MARLVDVAQRAGVSICTVSKILNHEGGVRAYSDECVARVREAAQELGYRRNYHAQALQTGRSDALGMVMPSPSADYILRNGFLAAMIASLDVSTRKAGYHFVLIGPHGQQDVLDAAGQFLDEGRVDGLIVPGMVCPDVRHTGLESSDSPIVLIDYSDKTSLPVINIDNDAGIRRAVRHVHELGHRRVLWVGPKRKVHRAVAERRSAFWDETTRRGIEAQEQLLEHPRGREEGRPEEVAAAREAATAALRGDFNPTAIVCYHETMALGVYAAAYEAGLRIPDDISIVGFDDVYAQVVYPPMTVVSHMLAQVSREATLLIADMIGDADAWQAARGRRIVIEPELVVRGSTGRAP
jgi:LacI family transcriptional regulator